MTDHLLTNQLLFSIAPRIFKYRYHPSLPLPLSLPDLVLDSDQQLLWTSKSLPPSINICGQQLALQELAFQAEQRVQVMLLLMEQLIGEGKLHIIQFQGNKYAFNPFLDRVDVYRRERSYPGIRIVPQLQGKLVFRVIVVEAVEDLFGNFRGIREISQQAYYHCISLFKGLFQRFHKLEFKFEGFFSSRLDFIDLGYVKLSDSGVELPLQRRGGEQWKKLKKVQTVQLNNDFPGALRIGSQEKVKDGQILLIKCESAEQIRQLQIQWAKQRATPVRFLQHTRLLTDQDHAFLNTVIGSSAWHLKNPPFGETPCMVASLHVVESGVGCIVAAVCTMNAYFSKFSSKVAECDKSELLKTICSLILTMVKRFRSFHKVYPFRLIFYRSGYQSEHLLAQQAFLKDLLRNFKVENNISEDRLQLLSLNALESTSMKMYTKGGGAPDYSLLLSQKGFFLKLPKTLLEFRVFGNIDQNCLIRLGTLVGRLQASGFLGGLFNYSRLLVDFSQACQQWKAQLLAGKMLFL